MIGRYSNFLPITRLVSTSVNTNGAVNTPQNKAHITVILIITSKFIMFRIFSQGMYFLYLCQYFITSSLVSLYIANESFLSIASGIVIANRDKDGITTYLPDHEITA